VTRLLEESKQEIGPLPDVLASPGIFSPDEIIGSDLDATQRQLLYCGFPPDNPEESEPKHVDVLLDNQPCIEPIIDFDVDSLVAFASSLAVARTGIQWLPHQSTMSVLTTDLHMAPIQCEWTDQHSHIHRRYIAIHKIPNFCFGRINHSTFLTLHILFPELYTPLESPSPSNLGRRLRESEFMTLINDILLPIIYRHVLSSTNQAYPASYHHAKANSRAHGRETHQRDFKTTLEQQITYFLPADSLDPIWQDFLAKIEQPGYRQFRRPVLLLQAKNLKDQTRADSWGIMFRKVQGFLNNILRQEYIRPNSFLDVAKQITPLPAFIDVLQDPERQSGQSIFWRSEYLDRFFSTLQSRIGDPQYPLRYQSFPLLFLKNISGGRANIPLSSRLRKNGLAYIQLYSRHKEIFNAAGLYSFSHTSLPTLSLSPNIIQVLQYIGGATSISPQALLNIYLATKSRCHFGILHSQNKSFGLRKEYRVAFNLFHAINTQMNLIHPLEHITPSQLPDLGWITLSTALTQQWCRWNLNKIILGFEVLFSRYSSSPPAWEHSRIMGIFLRCFPFFLGSLFPGTYPRLWYDILPSKDNVVGPYRHGLGMGINIERHGYAWLMNRIDWDTLTIHVEFIQSLGFEYNYLQQAFRRRHRQVRDTWDSILSIERAPRWFKLIGQSKTCINLITEYLCQLCLETFRKDIGRSFPKKYLDPDHAQELLDGIYTPTYAFIQRVSSDRKSLLIMSDGRQRAKTFGDLFAWLWEDDDDHPRGSWAKLPFRQLYRRCLYLIRNCLSEQHARKWRRHLQRSLRHTHWLLPYPCKGSLFFRDSKRYVRWWSSYHPQLYNDIRVELERQRQPRSNQPRDILEFEAGQLDRYSSLEWTADNTLSQSAL